MLQGAELLRMALKEDSTETLKRNYPILASRTSELHTYTEY
jgi:hypothetical protein